MKVGTHYLATALFWNNIFLGKAQHDIPLALIYRSFSAGTFILCGLSRVWISHRLFTLVEVIALPLLNTSDFSSTYFLTFGGVFLHPPLVCRYNKLFLSDAYSRSLRLPRRNLMALNLAVKLEFFPPRANRPNPSPREKVVTAVDFRVKQLTGNQDRGPNKNRRWRGVGDY